MKKFQRIGVVGAAMMAGVLGVLLVSSGCEWDGGGDGYNSRYNWADFNGVYRASGSGLLVTDYTGTPGTDPTPGTTNLLAAAQNLQTLNDTTNIYSGTVGPPSKLPIVRGSFSIAVGERVNVFTDNENGTLSGEDGGTINYGTGTWLVKFFAGSVIDGTPMTASWQYLVVTEGDPGIGGTNRTDTPGTSGIRIYTFTVSQQGQNITLTDNNGSVYAGKIGNTRVNEGTADGVNVVDGSQIIAQFSVEGVSKAGIRVKIVGTLQGVVSGSDGVSAVLADRRMFGTWIEQPGTTGDINGEASPIGVTLPTTTGSTGTNAVAVVTATP